MEEEVVEEEEEKEEEKEEEMVGEVVGEGKSLYPLMKCTITRDRTSKKYEEIIIERGLGRMIF